MENKNTSIEIAKTGQLAPQDVVSQIALIQSVMKSAMKQDEHYGIIPGCVKPSLLKAGAEKLCLTFRLAPEYNTEERWLENNHYYCKVVCTLMQITSGQKWGEGIGSCSTLESKYRYRKSERVCPECGQEAIIKGKQEYGGGWLCWTKKGGCGFKFGQIDERITSQQVSRVENVDIADVYNTVLKIACKRALVAATLSVTAASDIFTQDIEDLQKTEFEVNQKPEAKQNQKNKPNGGFTLTVEQTDKATRMYDYFVGMANGEKPVAIKMLGTIAKSLDMTPQKTVSKYTGGELDQLWIQLESEIKEFESKTTKKEVE